MDMRTYIIGSRYHEGADAALRKLKHGQRLVLMREPTNPYDSNAVSIHNDDGQKLGYIPRQEAPAVARAIDAGYQVHAFVTTAGSNLISVRWDKP